MRKSVVLFFAIALLLAGCSKEKTEDQLPKMLNVELHILPKSAAVNELVTFQAKVTYGDEPVTDADDMSFEIWHADQKKTEKFEVTHTTDGLYQFKKRFNKEGMYYVYAHVTARNMHTMPREEFIIGTPNANEK